MLRVRSLLALVLVCALVSCASFQFESQRIFLRYQPDSDILDVLLVYDGVGGRPGRGDQEKEDRDCAEVVSRIAEGRRHFVVMDGPFEFDLTEIVSDLDRDDPLAERFLHFEQDIQVLESELVHGPEQEPCLLQRVRIRNASTGLRLLDAGFNREVLDDLEDDEGEDAEDALFLRRARENGSWVHFDGHTLVVSIPTTPHGAALGLSEALNDDDPWTKQIARSLTSLEIAGETALLRFTPAEDGWIRFSFEKAERGVSRGVQGILADRGAFDDGALEPEIERLLALE